MEGLKSLDSLTGLEGLDTLLHHKDREVLKGFEGFGCLS